MATELKENIEIELSEAVLLELLLLMFFLLKFPKNYFLQYLEMIYEIKLKFSAAL
ncbi:hypothetical protein [Anabaena azotica]|uniref:hypothetical protein n=1 Tax=Anabaena azotica TaxID=197653 RepID=UPI001A7E81F7|nr:hypothetical protein [Anabaena azotica]